MVPLAKLVPYFMYKGMPPQEELEALTSVLYLGRLSERSRDASNNGYGF